MIRFASKSALEIVDKLPKDYLVIDIGGASGPYKRGNVILDIVPWTVVRAEDAKGAESDNMLCNEHNYVQFDICSRELWPFSDKQFDYSICSHVLEDIRDPLWVCSEIIRTSKAGYIEIPSRLYETAFGIEIKNLAGAAHHRWLVDLFENKLRFTYKYMQVHSKHINKNRVKYEKDNPEMYLRLEWSDSFCYFENWLNSGKEIFEYILGRPISEKEKWAIYRDTQDRNIITRWLAYLKNVYISYNSKTDKHDMGVPINGKHLCYTPVSAKV